MNILWITIPVTLIIVLVFTIFFVWSAREGQFEDLDSPPLRALDGEDEK